ncbi:hypothetical protein D9M68_819510 [compost metagenome]
MGVVEGFDDAHAAFQPGDPVALVEAGGRWRKIGGIGAHGPECAVRRAARRPGQIRTNPVYVRSSNE